MKRWLEHFGSFKKHCYKIFDIFQKLLFRINVRPSFFLLFVLSLGLFYIKKIFQNCENLYLGQQTAGESIFASPVGGAQTHIPALTKGEPRARLHNPLFFAEKKKTILETIKSFPISHWNKYPMIY